MNLILVLRVLAARKFLLESNPLRRCAAGKSVIQAHRSGNETLKDQGSRIETRDKLAVKAKQLNGSNSFKSDMSRIWKSLESLIPSNPNIGLLPILISGLTDMAPIQCADRK